MSTASDHTMIPQTIRTCPYCAEAIKPAAKLCPRCRQWLTLRSVRNPSVLLWVAGGSLVTVLLVAGSTLLTRMERFWNPKPSYTKQLRALRVIESRMAWRQTTTDRRIHLTGVLTNQSQVPWRDVELECRFFDTKGVMIDVAHPRCSLTIQPWDDSAFSTLVYAARPTNTYASYTLTVNMARNANANF